jgi:hypothetical protein
VVRRLGWRLIGGASWPEKMVEWLEKTVDKFFQEKG